MKVVADQELVVRLSGAQGGVFSTADLRSALTDVHPASFVRRVKRLVEFGVLRRFVRGWYVAEPFDLNILSQRLSPTSAISFGAVLARELLIGAAPRNQVVAVRPGQTRSYRALGVEVRHLSIASHLHFAFAADTTTGVQFVDAEKAVLDVFYFHLRNQRYSFDPFSDIDFESLDRSRLNRYLSRYRNPKFVSFVERTLGPGS